MNKIKTFFVSLLLIAPISFPLLKEDFKVARALDYSSGAAYFADNENDLYYQGISSSLKGEELISALSTLTSFGFVTHSYSSLPSIYQYSDQGINNPNYMRMVYTGTEVSYSKGSMPGSTNKEHVWPASWYGTGDREEGAGSPGADAHNVWPSATDLNSKRGSCAFDELDYSTWKCKEFGSYNYADSNDPASYVYSTALNNSNGQNNDIMMPKKGERGIIARILMYVATRYRNDSRYPVMLHDNASTLKTGRIGKLSTLLKWHYEEPPSDFEMRRNNEVASRWHHNRNPFVDHPEYAGRIYYYLNEPDKSTPTDEVKRVIENYDPLFSKNKPQSIEISSSNLEIKLGESYKLNPTVIPLDASQEVNYSMFDNNIIDVNSGGNITTKNVGSTTIRISSAYYSSIYIDVTVNVYKDPADLISINFKEDNVSLLVGQKYKNELIYNPLDVYPLPQIEYESSNEEVAIINELGEVTSLKEGIVTIKAKIKQNDKTFNTSFNLIIKQIEELIYEGILIKKEYFEGEKFDPTGLNFKVKLKDESYLSILNSDIKFYDANTLNEYLKEGTTQIKAVYLNSSCIIDGISVTSFNKEIKFNIDDFSSSGSYSWNSSSKDGISIKAYIYGSNKNELQFNNGKTYCYVYNDKEISNLKSISIINNSKTTSSNWKLLASNTPFEPVSGNKIPSNYEKDLGSQTTSSVSYTVFDFDSTYKYFALCYIGSGVCYLDEIIFNVSSSSSVDVVKEFVLWINNDDNFIDVSCKDKYLLAKQKILSFNEQEIDEFISSIDEEYVKAKERYEAWCRANNDYSPYIESTNQSVMYKYTIDNPYVFILLFGMFSVLVISITIVSLIIRKKTI